MDNINFKGTFLIKKPREKMWDNIKSVLPNKKCVFEHYNEAGDKLFVVKDWDLYT